MWGQKSLSLGADMAAAAEEEPSKSSCPPTSTEGAGGAMWGCGCGSSAELVPCNSECVTEEGGFCCPTNKGSLSLGVSACAGPGGRVL